MLPTIKGRPKDLDVRKTWTSERPGRPKDLDVRGPGCPGTWKSERPGCPKDLDVRGPGCPGTWMSGDLDVRDLYVRDLDICGSSGATNKQ